MQGREWGNETPKPHLTPQNLSQNCGSLWKHTCIATIVKRWRWKPIRPPLSFEHWLGGGWGAASPKPVDCFFCWREPYISRTSPFSLSWCTRDRCDMEKLPLAFPSLSNWLAGLMDLLMQEHVSRKLEANFWDHSLCRFLRAHIY